MIFKPMAPSQIDLLFKMREKKEENREAKYTKVEKMAIKKVSSSLQSEFMIMPCTTQLHSGQLAEVGKTQSSLSIPIAYPFDNLETY